MKILNKKLKVLHLQLRKGVFLYFSHFPERKRNKTGHFTTKLLRSEGTLSGTSTYKKYIRALNIDSILMIII